MKASFILAIVAIFAATASALPGGKTQTIQNSGNKGSANGIGNGILKGGVLSGTSENVEISQKQH
ncbi:hypothetical protein DFQ28_001802 [Apophysomyces sp. BC1034]|nr:hypothetical protein DFQ29_010191 [Apophysomyces sp. BC1021]KAG0190595.1 hypothetical protein DFQ28_001802 [Apophysomyces sp. BC1034]